MIEMDVVKSFGVIEGVRQFTNSSICTLSQLLELLEGARVSLIHGWNPLTSS